MALDNSKTSNSYYVSRQEETESNARSYPRKFPFALKKAKGLWIEDVEGNKYLDFLCGAGTLALGHNDPEINQAMIDLISEDAPLHTLDLTTPVKDEFVHMLLSLLPGELKNNAKIQFCSPSGTDATDAALKLCKTATGRSEIIAFSGGYHGMGHGALALTGNLNAKNKVHGLMPGVHFMPYPYSYRCPFGLGGDAGVKAACAYFERLLKDPESGITKPAAVILEPIQGEGGVIPAPVEFLQTVRRVTQELDIPMIVDEIQCGIGRSGTFFAFEEAHIVPDVILASKAIGGSQPMAVVIYNKKLDLWTAGAHAGTFRGNQLAMKAGLVVMNRVSKPEFLAEVKEKGEYLKNKLLELKAKHPIIGDIRGRGLMLGCEFVDPTGKPDAIGSFPASGEIAAAVQKKCFENKLIMEKGGRFGSVMRCLCALTVTKEEIDTMLSIFEKSIKEVESCGK
ncbi:MAG: diaminobutyrate--2-oxoglutarate transaminase [Candidatus Treponema excrementipullorum]|nr:diaminobutyrate--2-oxoglutarate transaminase [Spirochaetia bacterium]MCI6953166.1 diaminobutyrate--2-oxoglutarate transaminase [Spirochaetia bacterium]MDD7012378.1 diaminobutyrate--2-oxoglutarate transaminase [Candidatus Treponema excrementipullorum]MDY4466786.1 diaminobutyrate--2-oxoglutarate transaminase [Candidatus Treponema excrementipullorum]MDY4706790.1 diaminobutyrate--2-oxoglutarate transaminase [Candidatus Treponema excrementipullorum]